MTELECCAERTRLAEEVARLDLKWAAASWFIRDVIEAVGQEQPETDAVVDLPAIALQVVGQIEELKIQHEHDQSCIRALQATVADLQQFNGAQVVVRPPIIAALMGSI